MSDDTPEVLSIVLWQSFEIDCSECGRESVPSEESTGERIVGDSGIAGWRPLCKACAMRLGLET